MIRLFRLFLLYLTLLMSAGYALAQPGNYFEFCTYDDSLTGRPIPIMHDSTAVPTGRFVQIISTANYYTTPYPTILDSAQSGLTTAGMPGTGNVLRTTFAIGTGSGAAGTFDVFLTLIPQFPIEPPYFPRTFWCRVWFDVPAGASYGIENFGGRSYCDCGPFRVPLSTEDPFGFGPEVICYVIPSNANPIWHTLPTVNQPNFSIKINGFPNPRTIRYDTLLVGATASVPVVISNIGGDTLTLASTFIPLTRAFSWRHPLPLSIAAADSFRDTLVFAPDSANDFYDTLRISHNAYGSPYYCYLEGTGIPVNKVNDEFSAMPTEFSLGTAYPNPFNSSVSFEVGIPHNTDVRLLVYNLLGQQVASLHSGSLTAGYHRFEWNATGNASGSYFVKMEAQGIIKTQTIRYVR